VPSIEIASQIMDGYLTRQRSLAAALD